MLSSPSSEDSFQSREAEESCEQHVKKIVWSRDKRTFHIDIASDPFVFNHVFTLPRSVHGERMWHWHLTAKGLTETLIDLVQYMYNILLKYENDNPHKKDLYTAFSEMWPLHYNHRLLCPHFRLLTCFVAPLSSSAPKRLLYCPIPLSRELLCDSVITTPGGRFIVELRLKLRKRWLEQLIWHHHMHRTVFLYRFPRTEYPTRKFVSRLKHH